ncbi:unnamed protein product [Periconia digitata]|uniref:Uncharacterized protein n=1 Tax=Periconia digitata TaxID=1303443 RepID=A0A9W4UBN9_9PLEO|nr:unnamed protein product [Periconia digitata]
MADDPAVRTSTLSALKQSCPSVDYLPSVSSPRAHHTPPAPSPTHPSPMDNPFTDDQEWSDEEVLLPKNKTKTRYVPSPAQVRSRQLEEDMSSESDSSSGPRSINHSPLVPPKSPSRPDVRAGSTQEDLIQRFYQVTRERDALRKELQRKSMGPDGIPTRDSVVYSSDEATLIEDLQNLREEICRWSKEYFWGPPTARARRPHVHSSKELFSSLTEDYTSYLKHPNDRPLLIQAYIWSQLQRRIFSNLDKGCGYVWAGKLGDRKLRPINDTLRKAVKNEEQAEEYHRWRALTVNLLVPEVDGRWSPTFDAKPILKWIRRFRARLMRRLRPWSTMSLRDGKDQLYTIVSAAVALDLRMKKQRADYRFVTFTGGLPNQFWGYGYYDSEMEDIDDATLGDRKGRRVQMSLAPALERCGNANGHIFDQNFILVKADVTCKRLEKTRSRMGKKVGPKKTFWNSRS